MPNRGRMENQPIWHGQFPKTERPTLPRVSCRTDTANLGGWGYLSPQIGCWGNMDHLSQPLKLPPLGGGHWHQHGPSQWAGKGRKIIHTVRTKMTGYKRDGKARNFKSFFCIVIKILSVYRQIQNPKKNNGQMVAEIITSEHFPWNVGFSHHQFPQNQNHPIPHLHHWFPLFLSRLQWLHLEEHNVFFKKDQNKTREEQKKNKRKTKLWGWLLDNKKAWDDGSGRKGWLCEVEWMCNHLRQWAPVKG